MNILVVDDEYYIVKNIIETTDWSALGIEQAFPAYSASQAKQIFEGSQDIDVLLTDIEMPRETGLQLVEWLHENDFHPIVLVLTGHQRFDYAQEALNLHIFSYLLKPIDPDQLMEKLTAAVQEVKKNAWYEKERLNMEEHHRYLGPDQRHQGLYPFASFRSGSGPHLHHRQNPHEPGLPVPHFQYEDRSIA